MSRHLTTQIVETVTEDAVIDSMLDRETTLGDERKPSLLKTTTISDNNHA